MRWRVVSVGPCRGRGEIQLGYLRSTIQAQPTDGTLANKNNVQLLKLAPICDPLLNILRKRRVTAPKGQPSITPVEEILRGRRIVKFLNSVIALQFEICCLLRVHWKRHNSFPGKNLSRE